MLVQERRGWVLEHERAPEEVLHRGDTVAQMVERLLRVRQRQELVRAVAERSRPNHVIGHAERLHDRRQLP